MNKIYAIIYELRMQDRDYAPLYNAIKASGKWWHHLPSTWLIQTPQRAVDIWNALAPHIHKNDSMLVIEAGGDAQGWLPPSAWEWIKEHDPKAAQTEPAVTKPLPAQASMSRKE